MVRRFDRFSSGVVDMDTVGFILGLFNDDASKEEFVGLRIRCNNDYKHLIVKWFILILLIALVMVRDVNEMIVTWL